jgi:hypothetical protein
MTIPGLPDPRIKAFTDGWILKSGGFTGTTDDYWDPRKGAWVTYHSTDHTISNVGIPSPNVTLKPPDEVYQGVQQSWLAIKAQHPSACFDPREVAWREITPRTTPTTTTIPATPAEVARRMKLAQPELDALDQELQAGSVKPPDYDRQRKEILRKYGLPENTRV